LPFDRFVAAAWLAGMQNVFLNDAVMRPAWLLGRWAGLAFDQDTR
jgi:hypothetical protein